MTYLDVDVSRFTLSVSARDSIQAVLDDGCSGHGAGLHEVLQVATRGAKKRHPAFVVSDDSLHNDDPHLTVGGPWPDIAHSVEAGALAKLVATGLAQKNNVFYDDPGNSYTDDGRVMNLVHITRPLRVVMGVHRPSRMRTKNHPEQWRVSEWSPVVESGTYLIGMVGEACLSYVGTTAIDTEIVSEDTVFNWLVEQDSFLCSTCFAGCDSCEGRWIAETGSWLFQPEQGDAPAFDYEETDGHNGHSVSCPSCVTGRVRFEIT